MPAAIPAKRHAVVVVLLTALALGLYAPTLDYAFVFDDAWSITDNPGIRIESLSWSELRSAMFEQSRGSSSLRRIVLSRPLAYLSFALNYWFDGYRPRYYRLLNVLIHLCTGLLVYGYVYRTLARHALNLVTPVVDEAEAAEPVAQGQADGGEDQDSPTDTEPAADKLTAEQAENPAEAAGTEPVAPTEPAAPPEPDLQRAWLLAVAVAVVWVAHPLQTQSVTYIVQRMNAMAACFAMLAMCCYVCGREWGGVRAAGAWVAALLCWFLAVGSKQIAIVVPALIFCHEWCFYQRLRWRWLWRRGSLAIVPLAALVLVAMLAIRADPRAVLAAKFTTRDFTLEQRLLTESRVVVYYLSEMLLPLPSRLNLDHDFSISTGLLQPPTTLWSMLLLAALLLLAMTQARRLPVFAFGICWFFVALSVESTILPLELAFDHRLYLPSVGLLLSLIGLLTAVLRRPRIVLALSLAAAGVCGFWTVQRNHVWHDELTLWRDCAAKSPNKARTRNNLGMALAAVGQYDAAERELLTAIELDRNYINAYTNLGIVYNRMGRYQDAIHQYEKVLNANWKDANSHNNLAVLLLELGYNEMAERHFRHALEFDRYHLEARIGLSDCLTRQSRHEEALAVLLEALEFNPGRPAVFVNLGVQLARLKRYDEAAEWFSRALEVEPQAAETWFNLGNARRDGGHYENAVAAYEKAIALTPDCERCHRNLARMQVAHDAVAAAEQTLRRGLAALPNSARLWQDLGVALVSQSRESEAIAAWQRSVELSPELPGGYRNLGHAAYRAGRFDQARDYYQRVVELDPDDLETRRTLAVILSRSGDRDQAAAHYRAILERQPDHQTARNGLVEVLNRQAAERLAAQDLDAAAAAVDESLACNQDAADSHALKGAILGQQGQFAAAIAEFQRALAIDPDHAEAKRLLPVAQRLLK